MTQVVHNVDNLHCLEHYTYKDTVIVHSMFVAHLF